ncbi:MAG TPA: DUF4097 family beta strand repeat-containing protein [Candidatus Aquilonibacter sp.]|nr:DUF4097 family beta strand repeat-containing protein [Candidatus Aquilonibacter sp.]
MSNVGTPGVVPPPMPPRHRRRSFAGPLVLIIIGVVFLLGNLHTISWAHIGTWFAHYWPVLLILWGVVKLIEYLQAQREGTTPPGIGAGGVLLIVIIVVFGLMATQATRFNWTQIRDNMGIDDEDFDNFFGQTHNYDDHLEQDFPASASLKIIDNHGAVSVHASDDNKITVVVHKRVGAESQSAADSYDARTKPTITTIGGLVTLDAKTEAAGDHFVETDLDVSLPPKVPVSITSRRGDVRVVNREADVQVSAERADTSLEDIKGNVMLSLEKSSAKLDRITGDIHVEGRLNDVAVSDVNGSVQLDGEFEESVKIARVSKPVSFKSSRTDMEFSKIDGELDLDSDDLHADQITGPTHLTTSSKEIRLDEISGDVRLDDDNGGIEVSMRSLGNVQIDSRSGDIQLSVPEKAGFRLDARTRDGEIQSDFQEIKVDNGDREATATGTVGSGAAHIVLSNEHAGIDIRKVAPQPPHPPQPPAAGKNLPAPKGKIVPTEN